MHEQMVLNKPKGEASQGFTNLFPRSRYKISCFDRGLSAISGTFSMSNPGKMTFEYYNGRIRSNSHSDYTCETFLNAAKGLVRVDGLEKWMSQIRHRRVDFGVLTPDVTLPTTSSFHVIFVAVRESAEYRGSLFAVNAPLSS